LIVANRLATNSHVVVIGDSERINPEGSGTAEIPFGGAPKVTAGSIHIHKGGSLNADGQGFSFLLGPGAGSGDRRGSGYGGAGAGRTHSSHLGWPYGSALVPTALGSGGGRRDWSSNGGGAVRIAAESIVVEGRLSSSGGRSAHDVAYGGSGGSLWIESGTLSGDGVIAANGGQAADGWYGSGGGRIDIAGTVNNFTGSIEVYGGSNGTSSSWRGMAGSVIFPVDSGSGLTCTSLVISNELWLGNSQQFGEVVVTNGGCLYWDANEENDLFIFDSLDVHADSRVVFPGDYRRINAAAGGSADNFYGAGAFASGRVVRVHSGGKIDADGQGFPILMGPAAAKSDFGGAGHGGMGALRNSNTGVGFMYGTAEAPTTLGSGGGLASSGAGGGAIKIAAEIITVSGVISANGSNGTSSPGHGGSGGSIWLVSGILEGDGAIQVNSGFNNGGWRGSGGGRIDISGTTNNFIGNIEVFGDIMGTKSIPRGMTGSLLLPSTDGEGWTTKLLVVTNDLRLGNTQSFGALIVTNGGRLYLDCNPGDNVFSFESIDVYTNSEIIVQGDYRLVNELSGGTSESHHGGGATILADSVNIHAGGAIHADLQGFPPLMGPGTSVSADSGRGAGHGGVGGDGSAVSKREGGNVYGTNIWPVALGSGGARDSLSVQGGGAITLIVSGQLFVDGRLSANGGISKNTVASGSSGGSILVAASEIQGRGIIASAGGDVTGKSPTAGGGGGGKITVLYGETALKRDKVLAGRLDLAREVNSLAGFDGVVSTAAGLGYTGGVQQAGDGVIVYLQVLPPGGTVLLVR